MCIKKNVLLKLYFIMQFDQSLRWSFKADKMLMQEQVTLDIPFDLHLI